MNTNFTWTEVGCRLRDWRGAAGLSQRRLAEMAGLTQPGLHAIEAGSTNPQLDSLERLASALGRNTRELVLGVGQSVSEGPQMKRLERIVASGDVDAISAAEQGLRLAESLLDRRSGFRRTLSPELNEKHKGSLVVPLDSKKTYLSADRGARFRVAPGKGSPAAGKKTRATE
jgi:transcriptional regulator with XRE-family HTH domain